MNKVLEEVLKETDITTLLVSGGVVLLLSLLLTAMRGNVISLRLLRGIGIPLTSGKQHKDYRVDYLRNKEADSHLFIKNVCYGSVYKNSEDFSYADHSSKKKEHLKGELHLPYNGSKFQKKLNSLQKEYDKECNNDLLFIKGNTLVKSSNPLTAQFTNLRYFSKKDLDTGYKVLSLYRKGKVKKYVFLSMIETSITDKLHLDYTTRESFLKSLMRKPLALNGLEVDNLDREVIILNGGNDIEAIIVLAICID